MWDDLVAWFQSPGGARVLQTAIIPAVTIVVAAVVAAAIARAAVRATIRRAERAEAASVVAGLVAAARLAADAEGDAGSRLHAAQVRIEADVRARMLPLPGAALAADWAAARTDVLQQRTGDRPVAAELDVLRDRLIEWVDRPSRARRVFVAPITPPASAQVPVAVAETTEPAAEVAIPALTPPPLSVAEQPALEPREQERFARPASAPGPRRTPPVPEPDPEPALAPAAASAEPELVGATAAASALADGLPAWQRTRAVERLQQERSRGRAVEAPTVAEEEPVPLSTAPVAVPRAHRAAEAAAAAEAEEAVRLEAHQQARHARPTDQAAAAPSGTPAATPTPAPAWLDTYDDEAQVTQNLDLKTPPPVSASAVRDRGAPGDDLVPRS